MYSKGIFARILGILLAVAAALFLLTALLTAAGTSASLMCSLMEKHAPAETTGLPASEYSGMAEMITGYLAGNADAFQYTFIDDEGVERLCFRENEQRHMADVRQLFMLGRLVLMIAAVLLIVMVALPALGVGAWMLHDCKRQMVSGFLAGIGGILLLAAALIIWGAVDFDSLFVLFHRLSFSNELWLLNPQTDLLIRLMPIDFFVHYALLLGGTWLGMLAALEGAARWLYRRWNGSSNEEKTK